MTIMYSSLPSLVLFPVNSVSSASQDRLVTQRIELETMVLLKNTDADTVLILALLLDLNRFVTLKIL